MAAGAPAAGAAAPAADARADPPPPMPHLRATPDEMEEEMEHWMNAVEPDPATPRLQPPGAGHPPEPRSPDLSGAAAPTAGSRGSEPGDEDMTCCVCLGRADEPSDDIGAAAPAPAPVVAAQALQCLGCTKLFHKGCLERWNDTDKHTRHSRTCPNCVQPIAVRQRNFHPAAAACRGDAGPATPTSVARALGAWGMRDGAEMEDMLIEYIESVDHPCRVRTDGGESPGVVRGKLLRGGTDLVHATYSVELPDGRSVVAVEQDIVFDEAVPIRQPWLGAATRLVSAPSHSAPLRRFLRETNVPGLLKDGQPATFMDVFDQYRMYGVCILFFGGAVRAALLGNSMLSLKDVDVVFGSSPQRMIDIAGTNGFRPVTRPSPFKVQWGNPRSSRTEATMEGAPLCPDRNAYVHAGAAPAIVSNSLAAHLVTLDFACNSVVYAPLSDTFIDCSGTGIYDTLTSTLRIPAPRDRWGEWVGDNGLKLLRYWKMQIFGFAAVDRATHDWIVQHAFEVVPKMQPLCIARFIRGSLMHGKPPGHRIAREDFRAYDRLLRRDVQQYMHARGDPVVDEAGGRFLQFWARCVADAESGLGAPPPPCVPPRGARQVMQQHYYTRGVFELPRPLVAAEPPPADTAEAVCVCVDVSGSMSCGFEAGRSRLDAVKQMFYGFRDQTQTFSEREGKVHLLGLLSFESRITVHAEPTAQYDVFEGVIDGMRSGGGTQIYDAVRGASELLAAVRAAAPGADLRCVVLTDGQSAGGATSPDGALAALRGAGAVCDALVVGGRPDDALLRLVSATDGTAFHVGSLANAFETLESEAVVSLASRRGGGARPSPRAQPTQLRDERAAALAVGAAQAARPPAAQQAAEAVPLDEWLSAGAQSGGGTRGERLAAELRRLAEPRVGEAGGRPDAAEPAPQHADPLRAYPRGIAVGGDARDGTVDYVKTWLFGAAGTPYEGGEWEIVIRIPADYPMAPPQPRVATPLYHYAVSTEGLVCLPLVLDMWQPTRTLRDVLAELRDLVMAPERVDPRCELSRRSWLSELKRVDPARYCADATQRTRQDACQNSCVVRKGSSEKLGLGFKPDCTVGGVAEGSAAARAGLRGFVGRRLTHIGGAPVREPSDVQRAAQGAEELILHFAAVALPDGSSRFAS